MRAAGTGQKRPCLDTWASGRAVRRGGPGCPRLTRLRLGPGHGAGVPQTRFQKTASLFRKQDSILKRAGKEGRRLGGRLASWWGGLCRHRGPRRASSSLPASARHHAGPIALLTQRRRVSVFRGLTPRLCSPQVMSVR